MNLDNSNLNSLQNENDEENENNEFQNEDANEIIILSLIYENGQFAAAFYSLETGTIYVTPNTYDWPPHFNIICNLYHEILPKNILTLNKPMDPIIKRLKQIIDPQHENNNTPFKFLPKKYYPLSSCKSRVENLKLFCEPKNLDQQERVTYLNTLLDFSQDLMIHALGLLILYLDKNWMYYSTTKASPFYLTINLFTTKNLVLINEETFTNLNIFNIISHPSRFNQGIFDKEGFCLFKILNRTYTKLGMKKLRQIFVHPTNDIEELAERHKVIEFFKNPSNEILILEIRNCLKSIVNINPLIKQISGVSIKWHLWKKFSKSLKNTINLCDLLRNFRNLCPLFENMVLNSDQVREITLLIDQIIDFSNGDYVHIKQGQNNILDIKNRYVERLPDNLSILLTEENVPYFVKDYTLTCVSDVGFCLMMKKWKEFLTEEEKQFPNYVLMFETNDSLHYKTPICVHLDREVGDIITDITNDELKFLLSLVVLIKSKSLDLIQLFEFVAEFDCFYAMAMIAKERNYIRPVFTTERKIHIVNSYHPLLELTTDNCVPNDYKSDDEIGLVKIITGSNASGKSIYLKQVALLMYMIHIGSYIPAKSAEVCLLNTLHTQCNTTSSIYHGISTFLLELRQLSNAMLCASKQSLVIIDEFGVGTSELEGVSLLTASLETFIEDEDFCPHILVASNHFKIKDLLPGQDTIHYQLMDQIIDDANNIVFLYKVIDGYINKHNAISLAAKTLKNPELLQRCKKIFHYFNDNNFVGENLKNELKKNIKKSKVIFGAISVENDFEHVLKVNENENVKKKLNIIINKNFNEINVEDLNEFLK